MFKIAVTLSALLAVAVASPLGFGLGAPLVPKVSYNAPEVTAIQPEITVQAPEFQYKSVPVPVAVPQPVVQTIAYAAAPQPIAYAAPQPIAYAAPQPIAYAAAPQPIAYAAPQPIAYAAAAHPAVYSAGFFPYGSPVTVELKKD